MADVSGKYWLGSDGNYYLRANNVNGVVNLGKSPSQNQSFTTFANSGQYQQMDDPNPQTPKVTTTTAATGGSGSGTKKVDNTAAISNTQKAIDSLGTEQSVGYSNVDNNYNSVIGEYDADAAKATADYQEQDVTNNTNLLKNKQNALAAAAQGRRGLRGTLSAIGALSGDGTKLADRAVTESANQDIGGAVDTFATNTQSLTKAQRDFEDDDKKRRAQAVTERDNNRNAVDAQVLSKRQNYYQKMADLFSENGDQGNTNSWLNKAGDLNNEIASKGVVNATPFTRTKASFDPASLENYMAGAGDMTVQVQGGDQGLGRGVTTIAAGRKKEREL